MNNIIFKLYIIDTLDLLIKTIITYKYGGDKNDKG